MELAFILFLAVCALLFGVFLLLRSNMRLRAKLSEALSRKQSLSTKYGRMTEQFMPFLEVYPYDEHNFRFLGNPVDGVQFNDDGIVFVEFKTAGSSLSASQRRIKELVADKRVSFKEIRISSES